MQQQDQPDYNNKDYGYDNDYKDKRISYNNSYEDTKKYVHIQQKTRNMSVKEDNLKVSTLNQLNFVN